MQCHHLRWNLLRIFFFFLRTMKTKPDSEPGTSPPVSTSTALVPKRIAPTMQLDTFTPEDSESIAGLQAHTKDCLAREERTGLEDEKRFNGVQKWRLLEGKKVTS